MFSFHHFVYFSDFPVHAICSAHHILHFITQIIFGEGRKPRNELTFTCLRLDWAVDSPSSNNYRTNPGLLPPPLPRGGVLHLGSWTRIAKNVEWSNHDPVGVTGKCTRDPPILLYNGYWVSWWGGKAGEAWSRPSTPSSAEVKDGISCIYIPVCIRNFLRQYTAAV